MCLSNENYLNIGLSFRFTAAQLKFMGQQWVGLQFTRDIRQLRGVKIFDNLIDALSFDLLPEDAPIIKHI